MKTLTFFFIFISSTFYSVAQTEYGNFKIVNTNLIYQKVFDQQAATSEKLEEFFKGVESVSNVKLEGSVITADITDLVVDYAKFKFSQVATPPILQTGRYSGKLAIDLKDSKYRVTITDIVMRGDIGYKKIESNESLTNYACTEGNTKLARNWCKPNTLGLLDQAFTDRFTYKSDERSSDW